MFWRLHVYVVHKRCANNIRWRCNKYSSLKCKAILVTSLDNGNPDLWAEHNHPNNAEEINVVKCIQDMKVRAKDTLAKPLQIYAEAVQQLANPTRALLPTEDAIKRTLRNHKDAKFPDPESL